MSGPSTTIMNVAEQLTLLEERRVALQRLIKITQSLESLQQGLQTVSSLRDSASGFPDEAFKTFEALGRKVRNLSDAEIKIRLDTLDQKVKTKLKLVLDLADELNVGIVQSADGVRLDIVNQLVDEFKKHAQTAIALRVLLENRGLKAPALALSVPEQTIKQQLDQIASRENQCRGEVVQQVTGMQADIDSILLSANTKPALQAILVSVKQALQENLDHLKAGKSISTLPIPIADIAIDATPFSGVGFIEPQPAAVPADEPVTPPAPAAGILEPPSAASAGAAPTKTPTQNVSPAQKEDANAASQSIASAEKRGFWSRFNAWLNTPWNVRWKDINRDKK